MDVTDLRSFYAERLGIVARRLIGVRIKALWPSVAGDRILGIGYPVPYLVQLGEDAAYRLAFMPAELGVIHWPSGKPNASALILDDALPLPGASVDRVLLIHSLELANSALDLLREIWRVTAPGGRIIVVVPNRAGIWARMEKTPFGHGRPFSRGQLGGLLREAMFSPNTWTGALNMPPLANPLLLRAGTNWERLGSVLWPRLAGVHVVEATKVVRQKVEARSSRRRTAPALKPAMTTNLRMRNRDAGPAL
ncbi:MAG: class I SAM-dependent methyltransferase [Bauldia sp.]